MGWRGGELSGLERLIDEGEEELGRLGSGGLVLPVRRLAAFFLALQPELDARLHAVVEAYARFWQGAGPGDLPVVPNRQRASLLAEGPQLAPACLAMQYLTGPGPWETCQDGILWSVLADLREAGLAESTLVAAWDRSA